MYECTQCNADTLNAPRGNGPILCPNCYWESMGGMVGMRGMRPTRRGENVIAVAVFVVLVLAWLSDEGILW